MVHMWPGPNNVEMGEILDDQISIIPKVIL